jgi:hypothetical protein
MCDRFSHKRQEYLCNDCFEELTCLGPEIDLNDFMDGQVAAEDEDASRAYWDAYYPETGK